MVQSEGFLGRLLGPLRKTGFSLMKNILKPFAKSVLISLGLTVASSSIDAGIHKKILGSGVTILIVSSERNQTYPGNWSKGLKANIPGQGVIRASEGVIKASQVRGMIRVGK